MRHIVAWVSGLVLVAVLVASMGTVAAQDASPAASLATLPSPLAEWAVAYSSADADRLLALYTDDALWEEVAIGLAAHGQDEIRAHLDRLYTAVPDFHLQQRFPRTATRLRPALLHPRGFSLRAGGR
ncbi:MAG: SnoaL-like domain [Thermomicrobiales bacterium]|nr:SnoaL-like domain [Thermomicrobiales bacterium]